ncbi:MAG: GspH/FimT family pseudopilin [Candidatus Omnitrophota bacterium]
MNNELRTNNGFSLIEILLAVVIMGILSAVVIPRVTKADLYNKFLVYTTAHQVAADIRLARRLAVTNSDDYKLEFSTDSGTDVYAIYKNNGGSWDEVGETKSIAETISTSGASTVTFTPQGAADSLKNFKFAIDTVRYQARVTKNTGSVVLETY